MDKGITPAVATVLLVTVTIAAGGTLYTLVNNNIQQATDQENNIPLNINSLTVESCYTEGGETHLVIRNGGTNTINASEMTLLLNGTIAENTDISPSIVGPQESFTVESSKKFGSETKVQLTNGANELTHRCFDL